MKGGLALVFVFETVVAILFKLMHWFFALLPQWSNVEQYTITRHPNSE